MLDDHDESDKFGAAQVPTTQDIITATRHKLQQRLQTPRAKYHPTLFMVCCEPDHTSYAIRNGVMQWARLDYLLKPEELEGGPEQQQQQKEEEEEKKKQKQPESLEDAEETAEKVTRQQKRKAEYERYLCVGPCGFIVEQPGLRRDVTLLNQTQCSSMTNWMPRGVLDF